jgi:hypothetical protein
MHLSPFVPNVECDVHGKDTVHHNFMSSIPSWVDIFVMLKVGLRWIISTTLEFSSLWGRTDVEVVGNVQVSCRYFWTSLNFLSYLELSFLKIAFDSLQRRLFCLRCKNHKWNAYLHSRCLRAELVCFRIRFKRYSREQKLKISSLTRTHHWSD